jgi:hypothetical protein
MFKVSINDDGKMKKKPIVEHSINDVESKRF